MSVATPDTGTPTGQTTSAPPPRVKQPVGTRRYRLDLIGASALLVAGAGLAAIPVT